MKDNCLIIRDLMPLCAEKLASDASSAAVQQHIAACEACSDYYKANYADGLPALPQQRGEEAALRAVKQQILCTRRRRAALCALLCALLLCILFSWLLRPHYLTHEAAGTEVVQSSQGTLWVLFGPQVTGVSAQTVHSPEGGTQVLLCAWQTRWDRIFNNASAAVQLGSAEETVVWYTCPSKESVQLYGAPQTGGMIVMPRLVLGYYLLFAVAAAAVLWLLAALCRNTRAARPLFLAACVPSAYIVGHICVMGFSTVSDSALPQFWFILACAACVYGVLLLLAQEHRERRNHSI